MLDGSDVQNGCTELTHGNDALKMKSPGAETGTFDIAGKLKK
jgi:hypothetical protein